MSWLLFLRPTRAEMPFEPTEEEERIVGEHFAYLSRLRDDGKLLLAGPSPMPADTIGIAIFEGGNEAEVQAIVAADPAIVNGVMTAEIRPLRISIR